MNSIKGKQLAILLKIFTLIFNFKFAFAFDGTAVTTPTTNQLSNSSDVSFNLSNESTPYPSNPTNSSNISQTTMPSRLNSDVDGVNHINQSSSEDQVISTLDDRVPSPNSTLPLNRELTNETEVNDDLQLILKEPCSNSSTLEDNFNSTKTDSAEVFKINGTETRDNGQLNTTNESKSELTIEEVQVENDGEIKNGSSVKNKGKKFKRHREESNRTNDKDLEPSQNHSKTKSSFTSEKELSTSQLSEKTIQATEESDQPTSATTSSSTDTASQLNQSVVVIVTTGSTQSPINQQTASHSPELGNNSKSPDVPSNSLITTSTPGTKRNTLTTSSRTSPRPETKTNTRASTTIQGAKEGTSSPSLDTTTPHFNESKWTQSVFSVSQAALSETTKPPIITTVKTIMVSETTSQSLELKTSPQIIIATSSVRPDTRKKTDTISSSVELEKGSLTNSSTTSPRPETNNSTSTTIQEANTPHQKRASLPPSSTTRQHSNESGLTQKVLVTSDSSVSRPTLSETTKQPTTTTTTTDNPPVNPIEKESLTMQNDDPTKVIADGFYPNIFMPGQRVLFAPPDDNQTAIVTSVNVEIRIVSGAKWDDDLRNTNSVNFAGLAANVKQELKRFISKTPISGVLEEINVIGFRSGSVRVIFSMKFRSTNHLITESYLKHLFETHLSDGGRHLGNFTIDNSATIIEVTTKGGPNISTAKDDDSDIPQWAIAVIVVAAACLIFSLMFAAVTKKRYEDRERLNRQLVYGRSSQGLGPYDQEAMMENCPGWEKKMAAVYENLAADSLHERDESMHTPSRKSVAGPAPPPFGGDPRSKLPDRIEQNSLRLNCPEERADILP